LRLGFDVDNWQGWAGAEQTWHLALFILIFQSFQMAEFTSVPICSFSVRKKEGKNEITKTFHGF